MYCKLCDVNHVCFKSNPEKPLSRFKPVVPASLDIPNSKAKKVRSYSKDVFN